MYFSNVPMKFFSYQVCQGSNSRFERCPWCRSWQTLLKVFFFWNWSDQSYCWRNWGRKTRLIKNRDQSYYTFMLYKKHSNKLKHRKIKKSLQDFGWIFLCYSLFACLHFLNDSHNTALKGSWIFVSLKKLKKSKRMHDLDKYGKTFHTFYYRIALKLHKRQKLSKNSNMW